MPQLGRHHSESCLRLCHGYFRCKASEYRRQETSAARRLRSGTVAEPSRKKDFHIMTYFGMVKSWGKNADDCVRIIVEPQTAAKNIPVSTKRPVPQAVTDYNRWCETEREVLWPK